VEDIIKTDLNEVMSNLFHKEKDLHNKKGGIELLTHGKVNRIDLTEQAFMMALTSYLNSNWQ
jgi:non-canonical (house-cleaning) NTP pyrophosphatase